MFGVFYEVYRKGLQWSKKVLYINEYVIIFNSKGLLEECKNSC